MDCNVSEFGNNKSKKQKFYNKLFSTDFFNKSSEILRFACTVRCTSGKKYTVSINSAIKPDLDKTKSLHLRKI